jgi:hypothetical protein
VEPVQAQSFLAIQKVPVIVRKHFTAAPPPVATGDRWSMDDSGDTFWSFTIKPVLDGDVVSLGQIGSTWIAQVSIKRATVRVGLLMDIYLGEHPSNSAIEHQEGYALICQRLYKEAEATVKVVSERVFFEKSSASGPDADTAVKNAVAKATDGLAYTYFMNSSYKAMRVGRAYDLVCAKTTDNLGQAVDRAFRVAELNPGVFNKSSKQKQSMHAKASIR